MKKMTTKQRVHRIHSLADRFESHMDLEELCIHEQTDVLSVTLANLLRGAMEHQGIEAVDDILSQFVATLSACTDPCDDTDKMAGLKIQLSITTNEEIK